MTLAPPQTHRWWHEHIIDWLLAHPEGSYKQCAISLGRSYAYICMVVGSDLFQQKLKERRLALNGRLDDSIVQRTKQAANKSLELLLDRIAKDPDKVTTNQALAIAEKTLAASGYGDRKVQQPAPTPVNVTVTVSREVLADARARIRAQEQRTLDLKATEVDEPLGQFLPSNSEAVEGEPSASEGGSAA